MAVATLEIRHLLVITSFFITIFVTCKIEDRSEKVYEATGAPDIKRTFQPVVTSVVGRVIDKNQEPIEGASVAAGFKTENSNSFVVVTTDKNGEFRIDDVIIDATVGSVKVSKDGYFNGIRAFSTHSKADNYVQIQLIEKEISGTFSAINGGGINVGSSGSALDFSAGSVIDEATGKTYNGTVSVSAFYLNPEDENFDQFMPGNLMALNGANEYRFLQTFGMMAVELEGENGEKLQLDKNKPATMTMLIPSTLLVEAPATIPLWYFDEDLGLWIEEGIATKQGDKYIGQVRHFSFWNCDLPNQIVEFRMKLVDQNDAPISALTVVINVENMTTYGNRTGTGITNGNGDVFGFVPKDKELSFTVYRDCGISREPIYTAYLGSFKTDVNYGVVKINIAALDVLTIQGNVNECSGKKVTDGIVGVSINGRRFYTHIKDGFYALSLNSCQVSHSVKLQFFMDGHVSSDTNFVYPIGTHTCNYTYCNTSDTEANIDDTTQFFKVSGTFTRNYDVFHSHGKLKIVPSAIYADFGEFSNTFPITASALDYTYMVRNKRTYPRGILMEDWWLHMAPFVNDTFDLSRKIDTVNLSISGPSCLEELYYDATGKFYDAPAKGIGNVRGRFLGISINSSGVISDAAAKLYPYPLAINGTSLPSVVMQQHRSIERIGFYEGDVLMEITNHKEVYNPDLKAIEIWIDGAFETLPGKPVKEKLTVYYPVRSNVVQYVYIGGATTEQPSGVVLNTLILKGSFRFKIIKKG